MVAIPGIFNLCISCLLLTAQTPCVTSTPQNVFNRVLSVAGRRQDTVKIEAWGANSLRVRVRFGGGVVNDTIPGALIPQTSPELILTDNTVTNGNLRAEVGTDGFLKFCTRSHDCRQVGLTP